MLTITKYYPGVTYLWVIFSIFAEVFQKMFRKMTAYQSPFQFGTLATEENFIDRVEDRAMLKQMLASHINVMLISPRRWGAENGGYPPTQNGDIRSLFWLFSLMALQN